MNGAGQRLFQCSSGEASRRALPCHSNHIHSIRRGKAKVTGPMNQGQASKSTLTIDARNMPDAAKTLRRDKKARRSRWALLGRAMPSRQTAVMPERLEDGS